MESKHLDHHYSYIEPRARCPPLQLDSSVFAYNVKEEDDHPDSALSTPSSISTISPITPVATRRSSCSSEPSDTNDDREVGSASRARSTSTGSAKDREKKKRSRVTPEQLIHLEKFFAHDRSPTAARRREISELLGMQERQTQIWFQNRRAKAKLLDGRQKGRSGSTEAPPSTPPDLSTGYEVDLHNLIHEDEPVTIIICSDLSVGTWRRISTPRGGRDLIAYMCEAKRCLTWFIRSGGYGFKMEIPFDTILETHFAHAAPGSGLATFVLSKPPHFYMENTSSPLPDGSVHVYWKRCADWTEGQQATAVLRHDLIGSAVQLSHLMRSLGAYTSGHGSDIVLHSPTYRGDPSSPAMDIPQPPLVSLNSPTSHYADDPISASLEEQERRRRQSYSGPITLSYPHPIAHYPTVDSRSLDQPSPGTYASHDATAHQTQSAPVFDPSTYREYPKSAGLPQSNFGNPIARSYQGQQFPQFYGATGAASGTRRHSTASISHYYNNRIPTSVLTTPYHPTSSNYGPEASGSSSATTVPSGLPAVMYESEEDIHRVPRSSA